MRKEADPSFMLWALFILMLVHGFVTSVRERALVEQLNRIEAKCK